MILSTLFFILLANLTADAKQFPSITVGGSGFKNIATALRFIADNGIISVSPGIYSGPQNTNLCGSDTKRQLHNITACPAVNVTLIGIGDPASVVILGNITNTTNTRGISIFSRDALSSISLIKNITFQSFSYVAPVVITPTLAESGGIAYVGGGVYAVNATFRLQNVVFLNNSADEGGAMKLLSCNVDLVNVDFINNTANLLGGAMATESTFVKIRDSNYISNRVLGSDQTGGGGGAIFSLGGGDLDPSIYDYFEVTNSIFLDNFAGTSGGAVYFRATSASTFVARNVIFASNAVRGIGNCLATSSCSAEGGALYVVAGRVQLESCDFFDNVVSTTDSNGVRKGDEIHFC